MFQCSKGMDMFISFMWTLSSNFWIHKVFSNIVLGLLSTVLEANLEINNIIIKSIHRNNFWTNNFPPKFLSICA